MNPFFSIDLIQPGIFIAAGVALLCFPQRFRRQAQLRHDRRLAELDTGTPERFFEERRSLNSYKPATRDRTWRFFGMVAILLGSVKIAALFFH
jgi:hypothetical protein